MQKVLSLVRRSVERYNLIKEGDKVLVGVSGGKDSMLLAASLKALSLFYPKKFTVKAISIDCTGGKTDFSTIKGYFKSIDLDFEVLNSDIFEVVFDIKQIKNPCSLCSRMRRGQLNEYAKVNGFNKVALGHHADDLIETLFLSLFYEGRLSTFLPKIYMDKSNVTQIRPLIDMTEKQIISAINRLNIPIVHNCCKANGATKRQEVKDLLHNLEHENKNIKKNIYNAICSPDRYNLFDKAEIIERQEPTKKQ